MPARPPASPLPTSTVHQQPTPKYIPNSPFQEKLNLIDTPADNSYMPTPSPQLLRYKAKSLLMNGNMPLFPAAKRDWTPVDEESIPLLKNLLWPPKIWRLLTPDQRLLAVEYAGVLLSQSDNSSLRLPERPYLIHNFHFLVLPGSAGYPMDSKAKANMYTYQSLLDIANGRDSSSTQQQEELLKALTPDSQLLTDLQTRIAHVPARI
ncbi:hypothetical protein DPMN_080434 [Dreissena polymorpha]|uniref:Uncharacterized protein n=1 Tax=Dreissena polymorpha TaxID=45954 RepID=A0A9D4BQY2_DREPO|nr:hypothetical protein DPMN_080434 [Dreissena polymorpha]